MKRVVKFCLMCSLASMMTISLAGCAAPGGKTVGADGKSTREQSQAAAPVPGDEAPGFTLKLLDSKSKRVKLASFRGKKPVILYFGSYT